VNKRQEMGIAINDVSAASTMESFVLEMEMLEIVKHRHNNGLRFFGRIILSFWRNYSAFLAEISASQILVHACG
jgi:hypothetical protein